MKFWVFEVALRYLKSKRHSRFLNLITTLSMIGVGVGVAAMVIVLSVMDGFEAEIKKRLMATQVHILVRPSHHQESGLVLENVISPEMILAFQKDSPSPIDYFTPVLSTEVILKARQKIMGVVLKGLSAERLRAQLSSWVPSQISFQGLYLGQELAAEMHVSTGDSITCISPLEREGPGAGVPRMKHYEIRDVYDSGVFEEELHTVFASLEVVRAFLRKSTGVTHWEITLQDFDRATDVAAFLRQRLPNFQVQDWTELNAHLFASLRLERLSMFTILVFIVIVASFNIITSLTFMVIEKKREIAILKIMGASHTAVSRIFLGQGGLIGWIGIFWGVVVSFLICVLLKRYEWIALPDIFYDRTLPVTFNSAYYWVVSLCTFVIVLLASLYPSYRASRMNPLEGIRLNS